MAFVKPFFLGACFMSGALFAASLAFPVQKEPPFMAGPPSCIQHHAFVPAASDTPSVEQILAMLPLPIREQIQTPPKPKPRPERVDYVALLIEGVK